MNRPTARQIEDAHAMAAFHASQVQRHDRQALHAVLGGVLAILVACGLVWALLTWADCTARGVAMCAMTLTPTRPSLWTRLRRTLRGWWMRYRIHWAQHDVLWLQRDLEAAREWVAAAPAIIEHRQALVDELHVQYMSDKLDSPGR
jgi:hypothetical protein